MAIQGQLTKAKLGYSMPVDSPLYNPFPVYYEDASILIFPYITSAAAAAALLPSQLALAPVLDAKGDEVPGAALAQVVFAKYGFSNIGGYHEVAQVIVATYDGSAQDAVGKSLLFAVRLHVDSDIAMSAGREIGGFPKKLGHIEFNEAPVYFSSLEVPKGLRICSGELNPFSKVIEQRLLPAAAQVFPLSYVSMRVIPDPSSTTMPYTPTVCQLIYTEWVLSDGTIWGGRGALSFTGASALNPYHSLPILEQAPAWSVEAPTTPGTALFRGRMSISKVVIMETF